ncbi:hypothetical protein BCR42DRAFT_412346 [Absidia repens]|uniref:Secreted protein n=1 Tax=Absidia repens TaxID=90262 RepID=A0A1X2IJL3_9FUNG|nr:hypothetical protein BCR42DRAFT_412346 [Absidia repens]
MAHYLICLCVCVMIIACLERIILCCVYGYSCVNSAKKRCGRVYVLYHHMTKVDGVAFVILCFY